MAEGFLHLFTGRPITTVLRDLLDILIVAYVIYRALLVLRGTRAIQMGIGLGIVFLVYLGAKLAGLVTLTNLLSWLISSIILIVVVIFQNDIRRALIRMGGRAWLWGGREQQSRVIDEVVGAATELARHRMGALIAFEQDANILEFVKSEGIPVDATVTRELLVSLFVPEQQNKLHDGAVLIRDLKIARAGVFFPMPETKILDASLGSRHRAALGITEETDAVVVVVSEERGTISFCFSGNIVSNLDGPSLRHALLGLFGRSGAKKRAPRKAPTLSAGATTRPSVPVATPRPSVVHPPAGERDVAGKTPVDHRSGTTGSHPRMSLEGLASGKTPVPARAVTTPKRPSGEVEGRPSSVSIPMPVATTTARDEAPRSETPTRSDSARSEPMPDSTKPDSREPTTARSEAPGPPNADRTPTPKTASFVPSATTSPMPEPKAGDEP